MLERCPRPLCLASRPAVHARWVRPLDAPGVAVHGGKRRRLGVHLRPPLPAGSLLLRLVVVLERRELRAGRTMGGAVHAARAHPGHELGPWRRRRKPARLELRVRVVRAAAGRVGKHGVVVGPDGKLLHRVVRMESVGRWVGLVWRRRVGGLWLRGRQVLEALVVLLAVESVLDNGVEVSLA